MKHSKRIDFLAIAALTMMSIAMPLALLQIASNLFPDSPVNRLYGSFNLSTASSVVARDFESAPILFLVKKSGNSKQFSELTHFNVNSVTQGDFFGDSCENAFRYY